MNEYQQLNFPMMFVWYRPGDGEVMSRLPAIGIRFVDGRVEVLLCDGARAEVGTYARLEPKP